MKDYIGGALDAQFKVFEKRGNFKLKIWSKSPDYMFWLHSQLKSGEFNKKENTNTASIHWENKRIEKLEKFTPNLHVFDKIISSIIKFQNTEFPDVYSRRYALLTIRDTLSSPLTFHGSPNVEYIAGFFDVSSVVTFVKHTPRIYIEFRSREVLEALKDFLGAGRIYKMGNIYAIVFMKWETEFQVVQLLYPHIRRKKNHFTVLYDLFSEHISLGDAERTIVFLNKRK